MAAVIEAGQPKTPLRASPIPAWFVLAFAPMLVSQFIRLHEDTALAWLICDYAGRLGTLLILAAIPQARAVAFQRQTLRTSWWETTLWIVGLPFLFCTLGDWVSHDLNTWISHTRLGNYPSPVGGLRVFDLTAGLVLVACHEEILFRRCARAVFGQRLGDGAWMIVLTALLFAAYHWWTGIGNMAAVFLFGIYAMLFLRRTGALWPLILAHFLTDIIGFS